MASDEEGEEKTEREKKKKRGSREEGNGSGQVKALSSATATRCLCRLQETETKRMMDGTFGPRLTLNLDPLHRNTSRGKSPFPPHPLNMKSL
ncbi:hypothetical protein AVEN_205484-1 [Araneus ventricosus]|uniref:Uncharacterized protein n=1 Tax=Araneus ventricosus TaxID=182803 RepID=A0A4Y2CD77_ARAVE|nr:hypothetical protein AVEN_205484-1 [Araneus ventricosus]